MSVTLVGLTVTNGPAPSPRPLSFFGPITPLALTFALAFALAVLPCQSSLAQEAAPSQDAAQSETQSPAAVAEGADTQQSVKPGINEQFVDPELDVSQWLGRFEIESREVYGARDAVLKACGIQPGDSVADIGAGTGFYSRLFAAAVGNKGWVFAVDISPRFLQHIITKSREDKVHNLTGVLCSDRSANLPPESVNLVFICDTYHHFEYPHSTLASIYQALKPGGTLVVVDFDRIPGVSREFIIGHVRAGKEVFRSEIENAGFEFSEEVKIPGFKENYLLRFRKP